MEFTDCIEGFLYPMPLLKIGNRKRAFPELRNRLYLSFSSEGYGHSSRALAIAREFEDDEIFVGSYSYALERMESFGYPCVEVPQEVEFIGAEGSFDIGKTLFHNQARALGFNQIVSEEMDIMRNYGVSLVVADGRMAPVLAASRLDIPCVVLTNQSAFYPFFERDSALVQLFGRSFEWVMKFWLSSAEEIFIPDFPPPDTVCLPNLSENFQVKKRTRFVGPLVAWQADEIEPIERDIKYPLVVVGLGGHAYRKPLFDAVLRTARAEPDIRFELLTTFKSDELPTNVTLHDSPKNAPSFFKAADLVITQGGHSTAMELLTLGKPSLVVPDANQIEQENNAQRLVDLGVSEKLHYDELKEDLLKTTMNAMLKKTIYREKAEELAQKAKDVNGAKLAADVLREYSQRLLAY